MDRKEINTINFRIEETELEGVKRIFPFYVEDERGYFLKSMQEDIFHQFDLNTTIYETFESLSKKNVIRGLHIQIKYPQIKYVRVIKGEIYDVVVDLREGSSTFGKWAGFTLSNENRLGLWIPAGYAHGFLVRSDEALVSYQCVGRYLSDFDSGILWNDKDLNIDWNIEKPIVSIRDRQLMSLKEFIELTK